MFIPPDISESVDLDSSRLSDAVKSIQENGYQLDQKRCQKAFLRELRTGKPPRKKPQGYDLYKKYVGRVVKREVEARKKSSQNKKKVVFRIAVGIATIGAFIISLLSFFS